jgi:Tol biopolymer transport system component
MTVDANTLRVTSLERLTAGPGPDSKLAISADGRRLAFTAKSERIRNWIFPFDATLGRITGKGQPASPPGRIAVVPTISRDGKKVAFCVSLGQKWDLWEASLENGRWAPIVADEYDRRYPQWSPDGTQLVYTKSRPGFEETQIMKWSYGSSSEEPITGLSKTGWIVFDWSSDGRTLLVSRQDVGQHHEVWQVPQDAAPNAEKEAKQIAANPAYELWQAHYSPNGRWIVFEAVSNGSAGAESTLYVVPAGGGTWNKLTETKGWADKPRWSPDGKMIYFVARRDGFFSLWGIKFDEVKGTTSGEPILVSAFEKTSLMIPQSIPSVALSITQNKLLLTLKESSGGIWVLDNVDQ